MCRLYLPCVLLVASVHCHTFNVHVAMDRTHILQRNYRKELLARRQIHRVAQFDLNQKDRVTAFIIP